MAVLTVGEVSKFVSSVAGRLCSPSLYIPRTLMVGFQSDSRTSGLCFLIVKTKRNQAPPLPVPEISGSTPPRRICSVCVVVKHGVTRRAVPRGAACHVENTITCALHLSNSSSIC